MNDNDDEKLRSDEEIAEQFSVPIDAVRRLALTDEHRAGLEKVYLSGHAERKRMPTGTPVAVFRSANGVRQSMATIGKTADDPNWQGEAIRLKPGTPMYRNVRDPRADAGDLVAHRVTIRCPYCGARVSEIHEFVNADLYFKVQAPSHWARVDIDRGRVGAGCRECVDGTEIDVDTGAIAECYRRSDQTGAPVTIRAGWRPRNTA